MEWKFNLAEIQNIADLFWQASGQAKVFAFHGEMGAGKTTFIHALCDSKGVTGVVGSPTFSIINEYQFEGKGTNGKIYHIDLYRLKDEEEARHAGVEDCLYNSDHICLVEWPEKAPDLFPDDILHVYIEAVGNQTRLVRIGEN